MIGHITEKRTKKRIEGEKNKDHGRKVKADMVTNCLRGKKYLILRIKIKVHYFGNKDFKRILF